MTDIERRGESPFDAVRHEDERGEYWMGRDLMALAGYAKWQNFQRAINDARSAMLRQGYDVSDQFSLVSVKTSDLGGRPGTDFRITRLACYFVFMNGDPGKPEIAAAQEYFALKTRQAEVAQQQVLPSNYLEALKALVVEVEAKEEAERRALEAEQQAALLRPPAQAWENLVDTGQDYDVATAANILNRDPVISTGRNRLFAWMLENAMLYRRAGGQLVPYAEHTEHLRLKPQSRPDHSADDSRARKEAHAQVRVTVRGLEWIQQRMREATRPDLTQVSPVRHEGNVAYLPRG